MVATKDIAAKAAELLAGRNFQGQTVIDLFGDRIAYSEISRIIGTKIGNPDLKYIQFTDEDTVTSMMSMGISRNLAESYVALSHGITTGKAAATISDPNIPTAPIKYDQFVEEVFLPAYKNV